MAEQTFNQNGAFKINDQYATALRYEVTLDGDAFASGAIKFVNGRKQVAEVKIENRAEAVEILGERNVANIEAAKGKEKDSPPGTAKGKLQSEHLAYKDSYTPDKRPENIVEAGVDREASELDAEIATWVTKRREQMTRSRQQRLQNEQIVEAEDITVPAARPNFDIDTPTTNASDDDRAADRSKAIPAPIKQRFIQADNKYYFPDKTHAFDDRGSKLATRSESQEVLRSIVAIAHARGWDRVTVRGTEDFRRAAWLEASLSGIEVSGYTASKVEKAHLATLLDRSGQENSVERGTDRQQSTAPERTRSITAKQPEETVKAPSGNRQTVTADANQEATASAPAAPAGPSVPLRAGVVAGKLLEHGEAKYQHDPKKEISYFVKLETARGEQTVWGVDLKRAVAESSVALGENVAIERQGSKPVTARERMFDENGKAVGERAVDTHRNKWFVGSVDKAEAFALGDRTEVVKKHPDLAPAYGTVSAARKFAEKQFPDNKNDQARFIAVAQQVVAEKIAHGEPVPAPKIRETKVQERPKQQAKDQERDAQPAQKLQDADRQRAR
ncbi:LPD7 domain-containing protein [Glaciimonas sp. GNP009]